MIQPPIIFAIETAVPTHKLSQKTFAKAASAFLQCTPLQSAFLHRVAGASQIEKRHTVVPDFIEDNLEPAFFKNESAMPTTAQRNALYKEYVPQLGEEVCKKAITAWGGETKDITHVISVSCTGMFAPGLEFLLIERLGLSRTVERLGINFMGCFGAFKGLAIAKALALENPKHRILVVCVELCSLHFQDDRALDTFVANSIFADGAAAVVVGVQPRAFETPLFEIHQQASEALPDTLGLMSWETGNHGFQMRLHATVPAHLETHIKAFVDRLTLNQHPTSACSWAVHPGGKSILESIEKVFNLNSDQLAPSWNVLRQFGNMSSPTFLFVLKEILHLRTSKKWIIGLGFGPGLSIEGELLKYVAK